LCRASTPCFAAAKDVDGRDKPTSVRLRFIIDLGSSVADLGRSGAVRASC
jgi:hypothetical protein